MITVHWLAFNRYCAGLSRRGSIRAVGSGIEAAWTNSTLPINNLTTLTAPVKSPTELRAKGELAIKDAVAHGSGLPWMFGTPEPFLEGISREDAEAALSDAGLQFMMAMNSMECEAGHLAAPVRPLPVPGSVDGPAVEVRRIQGSNSREAYDALYLNTNAYGLPPSMSDDVIDCGAYFAEDNKQFGYVVYADGEPASTATVMLLDGWAYVAAVATAATQRRKGYAELAMRQGLEAAGAHLPTVLDASAMGTPLYAQMGYQHRYVSNYWIAKSV